MAKRMGLAVCLVLLLLLFGCSFQAPGQTETQAVDSRAQIILDTERACATHITELCDTLYEDELSTLYNYLDSPEDFESNAAAFEAVESIMQKTKELNQRLAEMYDGEITVY